MKWLDWKGLNPSNYWTKDCPVQLHCHTTKLEQILECLLTKMNTNQAKMDATLKELKAVLQHLKEEMRAGQ
jgi:hypothetical protein